MNEGGYAEMVKPPGHDEYLRAKALEQEAKLAKKAAEKGEAKAEKGETKSKGKKRKLDDDDQNQTDETDIKKRAAGDTVAKSKTEVKSKSTVTANYKMNIEEKAILKEDTSNKKLWTEVLGGKYLNKRELTDKIEEQFCCMICQDVVFKPVSYPSIDRIFTISFLPKVTTPCGHNICLGCLNRSFKAKEFRCPSCRSSPTPTHQIADQ